MTEQKRRGLLLLLAGLAGVLSAVSMIMGGQVTLVRVAFIFIALIVIAAIYRDAQKKETS